MATRSRLRRWLRRIGLLFATLLVLLALPALYVHGVCRGEAIQLAAQRQDRVPITLRQRLRAIEGQAREEQRSFLTFPEWYIVYSSQEYAAYIADHRPSGFGYFTSAAQYWKSYCDINRYVTARYAFNGDMHLVNYVIGISHSVEFAIKGIYEHTLGRFFEWQSSGVPTAEERFAREWAADYGQFLNTVPWYEYPFAQRLAQLRNEVDREGPDWLRKRERRAVLTAELAVKKLYARLIGGGTKATFAPQVLRTVAVVANIPESLSARGDTIKIEAQSDSAAIVSFPRYAPFTDIVQGLAGGDARFSDIAGNDEILITAILPSGVSLAEEAQTLFRTALLSGEAGIRVGRAVAVVDLLDEILTIRAAGGRLEHVYDY